MNTYSIRKPRTFGLARAFLVSVILHILVVLVWVSALAMELFVIKSREFIQEKKPEPEVFVAMTAEMTEVLQAAPVEEAVEPIPPEPGEKRFQPTQASQESDAKIESGRYFGERSTQAASELAGVEQGLEVPTQEGREARRVDELELLDTLFADGDSAGAPGTPGTPSENIAEKGSEPSEGDSVAKATGTEPREESLAQETPLLEPTADERLELAKVEARELLALEDSIELPRAEEQPEPEIAAQEEAIPKPSQEETLQAELAATGSIGEQGVENGFEREANRTRVQGTIRRRGESSVDVEDSVKGRFFAKVNKQIEREWQRQCTLRREHILPGLISVSFVLNQAGTVTGFRFDSRIAGGAIQEGFTMLAIQKAAIPKMPPEMVDELDGSELEMSLTFYF